MNTMSNLNDVFNDLLSQTDLFDNEPSPSMTQKNTVQSTQSPIKQEELDLDTNNTNKIIRHKVKNSEHQDYGRTILMARKDLYNQGKVNTENFTELLEEEQITAINKKAVWSKLDVDKYRELGFSPYEFHFIKVLRDEMETKPVINFKLVDDDTLNKKLFNFLYVSVFNEIKDMSFKHRFQIEGIRINEDNLYKGIHNHTHLILPTDPDVSKMQFYKDEMLKTFPNHHNEINNISLQELAYATHSQIPTYKDLITARGAYQLLKANKLLNKKPTWEKIQPLKLETKDKNDLDNIDNLPDLLELIKNSKVKTTFNNMTIIQVESVLNQEYMGDIVRNGYDYINGQKIYEKDLDQTFGVDAVQWGKWIKAENEKQTLLNLVYESFTDLAQTFNIPRKAIGLTHNGIGLGSGFGSQGRKGSKAHYQPGQKFLHLNRFNSVGSLAHEWFHAYDHYLYELAVSQGALAGSIKQRTSERFLSSAVVEAIRYNIHYNEKTNDFKTENPIDQEDIDKLKQFNPAFFELIASMNGYNATKVVSMKNLSNTELEFISSENAFADKHHFISDMFEVHKTAFDTIKTHFKNIKILWDNIEKFNTDSPTEKNVLKKYIYQNKELFQRNLNYVLSNSDEGKQFEKILLEPKEHCDFSNYGKIVENFLNNKEKIEELLLKNSKIIYSNVFNKENIQASAEIFDKISTQYLEKVSKQSFKSLLTPDGGEKSQVDVWYDKYTQHIKLDKENRLVDHTNMMKTITGDYNIWKTIKEPIHNTIPSDFIPKLKEEFEKANVPNYITDQITLNLLNYKNHIEHNVGLHVRKLLEHHLTMKLLNDDFKFNFKLSSRFKKDAEILDKMGKEPYYSTPYELFARMGETVVSTKTHNTYLSKEKNQSWVTHLLGLQIYPSEESLKKFTPLLEQSFKIAFKEDFDLDLSKFKTIENEYSTNEQYVDDDEVKNKRKVKIK